METIAVVGLGYVGLPLAVEFGKHQKTIGFDLSENKVHAIQKHIDPSQQITKEEFEASTYFSATTDVNALKEADFIIVAVPTPVNKVHQPDFYCLISASELVGSVMKKNAIVIYESTVYPGATEEKCIPVLEKASGLVWKKDFFVGYSPERINPNDTEHTLTKIMKVVSGDTHETLEKVAKLYEMIIKAGVHRASSLKVAEAAKVIENSQRDLNIAFVNELAHIFKKLGIDTQEVLAAASTKWNFLRFRPGLVGGHCIGVDPYYLTSKALEVGHHPQVILAGRRINDGMGKYIAEQAVKEMIHAGFPIKGETVNILGITFKEDCPDIRNSKVIDIIDELKTYDLNINVCDPLADPHEVKHEYGIDLIPMDKLPKAQCLIVAVSHQKILNMPLAKLISSCEKNACFIDVKSTFDRSTLEKMGLRVWRL